MKCSYEEVLEAIIQNYAQEVVIIFGDVDNVKYEHERSAYLLIIIIPKKYQCQEVELAIKLR